MPLSSDFVDFYRDWLQKAESYSGSESRECFDKFFTLYVLFNRLYAEATFRLARRGELTLDDRGRFPDAKAAQEYLLQYLGAGEVVRELTDDMTTKEALAEIQEHLRSGRFAFKLDMVTGRSQPDHDRELLRDLESTNRNTQGKAILEAVYAIRCNMFHGHKGYEPIQLTLLQPMIAILRKLIDVTYNKLEGANS